MIRRLHVGLRIPIDLLVGEESATPKKKARRKKHSTSASLRSRGQVAAKIRER
jgi:hypothetical protein